jgi:hypothetical protein
MAGKTLLERLPPVPADIAKRYEASVLALTDANAKLVAAQNAINAAYKTERAVKEELEKATTEKANAFKAYNTGLRWLLDLLERENRAWQKYVIVARADGAVLGKLVGRGELTRKLHIAKMPANIEDTDRIFYRAEFEPEVVQVKRVLVGIWKAPGGLLWFEDGAGDPETLGEK